MSKKFTVNGHNVWVDEESFNDVCNLFKENVHIDNLEDWKTKVSFYCYIYLIKS